jgi:hypothetical protein
LIILDLHLEVGAFFPPARASSAAAAGELVMVAFETPDFEKNKLVQLPVLLNHKQLRKGGTLPDIPTFLRAPGSREISNAS